MRCARACAVQARRRLIWRMWPRAGWMAFLNRGLFVGNWGRGVGYPRGGGGWREFHPAGGLLITEAGGLAGNYTGEPDFLERGEIVAANPKLYAQMVTVLKPHSGAP